MWAAYKEIVPAVLRQLKDQSYYVRRELPRGCGPVHTSPRLGADVAVVCVTTDRWVPACRADDIETEDIIAFEPDGEEFAIYRIRTTTILRHRRLLHPRASERLATGW